MNESSTAAPTCCFSRLDVATLSGRQRAVALLAGQALTNGQIARRLNISPHTVNFHLRHIFRKLGIHSRVSLAGLLCDHARRSPA